MPAESGAASTVAHSRPPRDNLVRACSTGLALRLVRADEPPAPGGTEANAADMPTLYGHFTRFDEWTEIDSFWEGNFMERVAPGSFKKTFRESTPKVLFQHGSDPQIGDKPLGAPDVLREEGSGPYYEVPLLDTSYNRDLVPGLEAGLYGASFRFSVMREEWIEEPGASDHNPNGLPERTIKEVRCPEFGPVTFPAYEGATAGVRSMTDEFIVARATRQPERLRSLLRYLETVDERRRIDLDPEDEAPETPDPEPPEVPEPDPAPSPEPAEDTPHELAERRTDPPRVTTIHPINLAAPRSALTPLHSPKKKGRLP